MGAARAARQLLAQAQALQDAGCFALVIECVPEEVTAWITRAWRAVPGGAHAVPSC